MALTFCILQLSWLLPWSFVWQYRSSTLTPDEALIVKETSKEEVVLIVTSDCLTSSRVELIHFNRGGMFPEKSTLHDIPMTSALMSQNSRSSRMTPSGWRLDAQDGEESRNKLQPVRFIVFHSPLYIYYRYTGKNNRMWNTVYIIGTLSPFSE